MHHHRRLALVAGLLALATILPARAQSWRGSEALRIQANDSKGKPIAGARVVVSFQGRGSEGNPPEVATDQKGRAVVAGLATGPWQVEVQHPEFLTYVAVFDLQQGKKPSINASFLEAGGRSLTPMKVKLSKGNPRDASPPLPAREARSQAPAPSEPDRATVEAAPTPPPVEATRAPDATITEEPSRQEEAKPKPEPEPEPVEATRAPEAAIAEESSQREEAKPEPEPEVEVQVAEEPLTPSPAESAPPIEESALPEVQETQVPEPSPVPVPKPEQEQLPAPQQASPSTVEPSAPTPPQPEPQSEPTLEATTVAPEPESQSDISVEPAASEDAPAEPESSLVAEVVDEIPAAQAPPPTEPESIAPEPVEDAPAIEVKQVVEAPPAPPAGTASPDDTPNISSYRDGSCSECRIGEWAVTSTQTVAAGTVPCPAAATQAARDAAESLGNSTQLELSGFVGPGADGSSTEALASVEPAISQAILQQLAAYLGGTSNCQMVSVVLPKSVRFAGYRYEAFDGAGGGECAPDRDCLQSRAQWLANPVVQRGFNATVVWGIFENTAEDEQRLARLKVYFRPPSAQWKPPTR